MLRLVDAPVGLVSSVQTKTCGKCKHEKDKREFNKRSHGSKDGLQYWCRQCASRYKAERQHTRIAYNTRYYRTGQYRAKAKKRQQALRESCCLKDNARTLLQRAVATGIIKKPNSCSSCKLTFLVAQIQGHHTDYRLSYHVVWLCPKCHAKHHPKRALYMVDG